MSVKLITGVAANQEQVVNTSGEASVTLTSAGARAGYAQQSYLAATGATSKVGRISSDGSRYVGEVAQIFDLDFNAASTNWTSKISTNATTLAKAVTNGAMRLNSGAVTTTTTGISIYSNRVFTVEHGSEYRVSMTVRHTNATATNKQVDIGLGYYAFASGQAAAMNEFIGFRWTTTGGLLGVVETSQGGAPTSQTVNINSNVPYADAIFKQYEIVFTDEAVEFWVDNVYQAQIAKPSGSWGVLKGTSLPWIARQFHSGAASAAPTYDIGEVSIFKIGPDDGQTYANRMSGMGKHSILWQPDLTTGVVNTHNVPASGTAPTAATGSNTASVLNNTANMGGFFRMNGASITATTHIVVWVAGYQNPAIPTAAGVATNARNFWITGITVSPMVVTTVLAGGGFAALWCASIGGSALSTATADADGTTAAAAKANRIFPLSRITSFGAAAAVGTIETGAGDNHIMFPNHILLAPGEFLNIGLRTLFATAAVTSGTIDGGITVWGYWE